MGNRRVKVKFLQSVKKKERKKRRSIHHAKLPPLISTMTRGTRVTLDTTREYPRDMRDTWARGHPGEIGFLGPEANTTGRTHRSVIELLGGDCKDSNNGRARSLDR